MIIISIFQLSIIQLSNIPIILDAAGHGLFANQIHFHAVFHERSLSPRLRSSQKKKEKNRYLLTMSTIHIFQISMY